MEFKFENRAGYKSFYVDEKKVKIECEKVKEVKYKVNDLLLGIERGNRERVIAHIRLQTPLNQRTVNHRNFTESFDAVEYALKCKQYDILEDLLKNKGFVTQKGEKLAEEDSTALNIIKKYRLKIKI
jgi:hypothetical protein